MGIAQEGRKPVGRVLVVFCSRDGHTRRVARDIAEDCRADCEEITERHARHGWLGNLRSAGEALLGIAPPIRPVRFDQAAYDLVVIGTPVWFWNVAGPVRSYVRAHRRQFRRVAFFCTYERSGQDKVLRDLQALCGRPPAVTLALTHQRSGSLAQRGLVRRFVQRLWRGPHVVEPGQTLPAQRRAA